MYEDDSDSDDEAPDLIEVLSKDFNKASQSDAKNDETDTISNQNNDGANSVHQTTTATTAATENDAPPCPVTILSGFLGSGKTTLIRYILKSPDHGKRIAVIENEFGEGLEIESLIATDGIDSSSLTDLIELPNGCVCCTVKDTLVETLEILIEKRSDLDYILIEASGMADPGPIASVFWLDDALESRLRLDGIVTLVDGKNILNHLEETEEASKQIAYADRIILNKVDLLRDNNGQQGTSSRTKKKLPSVAEVELALRRIQPRAPILKTSFSEIPNLDWILDANCFGGFDHLENLQTCFETTDYLAETNDHHDCGHHHSHQHDDHDAFDCCRGTADDHHDHGDHHQHKHYEHERHEHKHTTTITTIALEQSGSVDAKKLDRWLADILWPNQDETDTVLTAMLRRQEQESKHGGEKTTTETGADSNNYQGAGHAKSDNNTQEQQQQIFRIKGVVSIVSCEEFQDDNAGLPEDSDGDYSLDPRRFIVQAVHDLWDVQPVTSQHLHWGPGEDRNGKIVVIGKFLEEASLRAGFQNCFVPSRSNP